LAQDDHSPTKAWLCWDSGVAGSCKCKSKICFDGTKWALAWLVRNGACDGQLNESNEQLVCELHCQLKPQLSVACEQMKVVTTHWHERVARPDQTRPDQTTALSSVRDWRRDSPWGVKPTLEKRGTDWEIEEEIHLEEWKQELVRKEAQTGTGGRIPRLTRLAILQRRRNSEDSIDAVCSKAKSDPFHLTLPIWQSCSSPG
jgi:hypothetical protein